ncbi:MAG TPA: hypothetical protein VEK08_21565 [Planctomycetota bacterium]|nr:hypothetical protein [Planctomycetota bacterium]
MDCKSGRFVNSKQAFVREKNFDRAIPLPSGERAERAQRVRGEGLALPICLRLFLQFEFSYSRVTFIPDIFEDTFKLFVNLRVPEAKNFEAAFFEFSLSTPIFRVGTKMRLPIKLNNHLCCGAVEVRNVWLNLVLAPEFQIRKISAA